MFKQRFKSALVFVPLVLGFTYLGGHFFNVFVLLILGIAAWEYGQLLIGMGYKTCQPILIGGVLLFALQRIIFSFLYSDVILMGVITAVTVMGLVIYNRGDRSAVMYFALTLTGILYLGWLGGYAISIRSIEPGGRWWAFVTIGLVMLVDVGAYALGSLYGKHLISPKISPHKSWEGFFGGILFGVSFGALVGWLFLPFFPQMGALKGALLGLILALVTPFGDVFISLLKRSAGVKDSGKLIPGHGGMLDRIDTWLWALMLGYYFSLVFA